MADDEFAQAVWDRLRLVEDRVTAVAGKPAGASSDTEKSLEGFNKDMRQSKKHAGAVEKTMLRLNAQYTKWDAQIRTAAAVLPNFNAALGGTKDLNKKNSTALTRGTIALVKRMGALSDYVTGPLKKENVTLEQQREMAQDASDAYEDEKDQMTFKDRMISKFAVMWQRLSLTIKSVVGPLLVIGLLVAGLALGMAVVSGDTAAMGDKLLVFLGMLAAVLVYVGSLWALPVLLVGLLVALVSGKLSPEMSKIAAVVGTIASFIALGLFGILTWPAYLAVAVVWLLALVYRFRFTIWNILSDVGAKIMSRLKTFFFTTVPLLIMSMVRKILNNSWVKGLLKVFGINIPGSGQGASTTNNVNVYVTSSRDSYVANDTARSVESVLTTNSKRLGGGTRTRSAIS